MSRESPESKDSVPQKFSFEAKLEPSGLNCPADVKGRAGEISKDPGGRNPRKCDWFLTETCICHFSSSEDIKARVDKIMTGDFLEDDEGKKLLKMYDHVLFQHCPKLMAVPIGSCNHPLRSSASTLLY